MFLEPSPSTVIEVPVDGDVQYSHTTCQEREVCPLGTSRTRSTTSTKPQYVSPLGDFRRRVGWCLYSIQRKSSPLIFILTQHPEISKYIPLGNTGKTKRHVRKGLWLTNFKLKFWWETLTTLNGPRLEKVESLLESILTIIGEGGCVFLPSPVDHSTSLDWVPVRCNRIRLYENPDHVRRQPFVPGSLHHQ